MTVVHRDMSEFIDVFELAHEGTQIMKDIKLAFLQKQLMKDIFIFDGSFFSDIR